MNIDKMIQALNHKPQLFFGQAVMMDPAIAEEIISMLQVVRVLRGSISITLNVGQISYTAVPHIIDSTSALGALAAYDEITKEKV